jgi:hypothetical protein
MGEQGATQRRGEEPSGFDGHVRVVIAMRREEWRPTGADRSACPLDEEQQRREL